MTPWSEAKVIFKSTDWQLFDTVEYKFYAWVQELTDELIENAKSYIHCVQYPSAGNLLEVHVSLY